MKIISVIFGATIATVLSFSTLPRLDFLNDDINIDGTIVNQFNVSLECIKHNLKFGVPQGSALDPLTVENVHVELPPLSFLPRLTGNIFVNKLSFTGFSDFVATKLDTFQTRDEVALEFAIKFSGLNLAGDFALSIKPEDFISFSEQLNRTISVSSFELSGKITTIESTAHVLVEDLAFKSGAFTFRFPTFTSEEVLNLWQKWKANLFNNYALIPTEFRVDSTELFERFLVTAATWFACYQE